MSNNSQNTLDDDEESYYSEEEVTCTEEDDDFEFKELEQEIYGRMGGPPPEVVKAMGKKEPKPVQVAVEQPKRPPHPLMGGGGGGNNSFLEQIKARGATPPAAVGSGSSSNKENSSPPSMPQRPPHPLMGGSGGNPLLDQIKARGAASPSAQGNVTKPATATSELTSKPKPPPPPKPLAQMSMAEQVAAMAAKRQQRLEAVTPTPSNSEESNPPKSAAISVPTQTVAANNAVATKSNVVTTTKPVTIPSTKPAVGKVEPKKNGFFGAGKKKAEDKVVVAPSKPVKVIAKQPSNIAPSIPVEEEVTIIKTYKPEPLPVPPKKPVPLFAQAKLKPVSRDENDTNNDATSEPVTTTKTSTMVESAALPDDGVEKALPKVLNTTTTTTTTTITKTKRITKSGPEYDVTEYKVGCACTVM